MDSNATSNEYVRGTLKTIVLNLLAEHDRMYGYEITQGGERPYGGCDRAYVLEHFTQVLHKLEQEGLLITESVEVDGRLRKYYSLTTPGSEAAVAKTNDLERFMEAVKLLLAPKILATE